MNKFDSNPIPVEEPVPVEEPAEDAATAEIVEEAAAAPAPAPDPAPVQLDAPPSEPEESPTLVTFTKPYKFEGKVYKEVDLAGLESMSASDMCAAEKHLNRSGMFSPLPEMTAEYVSFIAAQTSSLPIEFFKALPPRDFIRVKNKVTNFFYGED